MFRALILGACLAVLSGCNSARKTVTNSSAVKAADDPKQYDYHDLSRGDSAFRRTSTK